MVGNNMNVSFIKQMKNLEREVLLKSVELDDDGDDFQFELEEFETEEEIIAVAPKCVRCNTCVGTCPVNAIDSANIFRIAKITDKCVKCEICVQTCPVAAIKLIKNVVVYNTEGEDDFMEYNLNNVRSHHRADLCPTNAFTLEFKEFFEKKEFNPGIDLNEDTLYPYINKKLCIGCGACVEISKEDNAITLDRIMGPIIHSRKIEINHDSCVNCFLCEENCPVGAIQLIDGEVVLDNNECIRCVECTKHCPVGALKRVEIE